MLEASLHTMNSFLTLTYEDEHVPACCIVATREHTFTLNPDHPKNFAKRLRNYFPSGSLRIFLVGEYGHEGARGWNPHYHAALFGLGCNNKIQRPETGPRCYCPTCELVRKAWGKGNVTLDELNDTTAQYIGGYTAKKMTNPKDDRLEGRFPEFTRYPTRPGLAGAAAPVIAEVLKSQWGHLAFKNGDIPGTLARGGKSFPLDRYLKEKIRREIGLEKINLETGEVTYGMPQETIEAFKIEDSPKMYALQKALKDAPRCTPEALELRQKLDKQKARDASTRVQKALNAEAKHKIFSSKGAKKL